MSKQEKIMEKLQIKKSTGEILTARKPQYRGKYLWSVYEKYSKYKASAYEDCKEFLYQIADEIISYGITSANGWKFSFGAVFETGGEKYVLHITREHTRIYLLEE